MVISVPKMIGVPIFAAALWTCAFGIASRTDILQKPFSCGHSLDTDDLEKNWQGADAHLGFNHRKLERALAEDFTIIQKKHLLFQIVYTIRKKKER